MVTPTGLYPKHFVGFLSILRAPPDREAIAKAVRSWNADDLDEVVADAGMVMGIHRTQEEWLAHPQGQYLSKLPPDRDRQDRRQRAHPLRPNPSQPLSGISAISCSHVIASTTASRTLADYGAEVLHVARDQSYEHEGLIIDVNVGMRSTLLDLKDPGHAKTLNGLLSKADVFVEGFRGRAMGDLGFGPEDVAREKPGIIYLSCRAYGWEGPWWNRAAFDMEALTVTGFTLKEGQAFGRPRFPPTMVLNDYVAGYIGAAGILAALRRRARRAAAITSASPCPCGDVVHEPRLFRDNRLRPHRSRTPHDPASHHQGADPLRPSRPACASGEAFEDAGRLARPARRGPRRRPASLARMKAPLPEVRLA